MNARALRNDEAGGDATVRLLVLAMPGIVVPGHAFDFTLDDPRLLRMAARENAGYGFCMNLADGAGLPPEPALIGTEAVVEDFARQPHGGVKLHMRAARRFQVVSATPSGWMSGLFLVDVVRRPSVPLSDTAKSERMRRLLMAYYKKCGRLERIDPARFNDPEWMSWEYVAMAANFAPKEGPALLAEDDPYERFIGFFVALKTHGLDLLGIDTDAEPSEIDRLQCPPWR